MGAVDAGTHAELLHEVGSSSQNRHSLYLCKKYRNEYEHTLTDALFHTRFSSDLGTDEDGVPKNRQKISI